MRNLSLYRHRHKPGTAPGTLTPIIDAPPPRIHVIAYNEQEVAEADIKQVSELKSWVGKWPVVWVNVEGLGDVDTIKDLGAFFNLHTLALEDVLHTSQRPKVEDYESYLFMIARMISFKQEDGYDVPALDLEQIAIFLGKNYVLSFQERPGDCFDPVRHRIRTGSGRRIRLSRPDYLSYALLDAIVDGFFPLLETYGEHLDSLEEKILLAPAPHAMHEIHETKRNLSLLRQTTWPLREAIGLLSGESKLVRDETRLFLRDLQDHTIQVLEILESYRERVSGLTDLYLSSISNKMNEIMKVLTIIATIFMPLGFLAGIYGMNFNPEASPWNMPELNARYGYPLLLLFMFTVAGGMLYYFRRQGWLGDQARKARSRKTGD